MTGTRDGAIARIEKYFDDGGFLTELQRRVAIPTTSQETDSGPALRAYLTDEMGPSLSKLGYDFQVIDNPVAKFGPFMVARRIEDPGKPTVLTYGHGDVIRGLDLVGGDVVEVSPPFDPSGNTALVGATMMWEILCLLAEVIAQRKGRTNSGPTPSS